MNRHRSGFEYGLLSVLMLVACAAGVMPEPIQAQSVPVEGDFRGTADVSGLVDRLDQQQAAIDALRDDVDALLDVATQPPPPPDTPPDPEPQTPDPAKQTTLWINVSHFGSAPVVTPRGDGTYDIDPRFVDLMSQWSGIRYMDWTGQLRKDVNWTWENRVTDADAGRWKKTGLPLEAIIAVANATHTHVWWTAPQQADLNYMRRAGDLFARTLDPDLNVVLEVANEVWQSNRGWRYYELAGRGAGGFAGSMKLYARDSAAKFKAFVQGTDGRGFPADRLTRVVGGQLNNIGVLKSHVLKHLSPDEFDGITVSGYFGNHWADGPDAWRVGKNGLDQALADLQAHGDLARSINKTLLVYELNSHIENNRDLFNSAPVIAGVQTMIDKAHALGVKTICIYAGPGEQTDRYHWPSYTPDLRPNPVAQELHWPSLN